MDFLIHHMLRGSARRFPHKEALVHGPTRMSYAEVHQKVAALAYGLKTAGLERGDRLGIYLEPSAHQAISIFAASAADAVFVPINHVLYAEQVAHIMADCQMKAVITTRPKLAGLL